MYCFKSRVRYSETDQNGFLTLGGIVDYFQDCSTFQSEELGVGFQYVSERGLVWVLSSWQVVVDRYPRLGEEIVIGTFPYGFKSFMGMRNFFLEDSQGVKIAYASSIWTLMDMNKKCPTRPLPEMLEKYVLEEKLPMDYAPRKIAVEERGAEKERILIKAHHLDMNNHVNNGQYIRIAMEALEKEIKVKQMRAEYKKSAVLNDKMIPYVSEKNGVYTVELCNTDGELFSVVELAQE